MVGVGLCWEMLNLWFDVLNMMVDEKWFFYGFLFIQNFTSFEFNIDKNKKEGF